MRTLKAPATPDHMIGWRPRLAFSAERLVLELPSMQEMWRSCIKDDISILIHANGTRMRMIEWAGEVIFT